MRQQQRSSLNDIKQTTLEEEEKRASRDNAQDNKSVKKKNYVCAACLVTIKRQAILPFIILLSLFSLLAVDKFLLVPLHETHHSPYLREREKDLKSTTNYNILLLNFFIACFLFFGYICFSSTTFFFSVISHLYGQCATKEETTTRRRRESFILLTGASNNQTILKK